MFEQKKEDIFLEDDNDHIFRFELEVTEKLDGDPLVELVRTQLTAILDVVILVNGDKDIVIDGFKFINSNQKYNIWINKK